MELEDKLTKRIGSRIKTCRNEHQMKQVQLRDKLGISQNHISNLEQGNRRPSFDLLIEICDVFNVTPNYFLLESIEPSNNERLRSFYLWAGSLEESELERLLNLCEDLKSIMVSEGCRNE